MKNDEDIVKNLLNAQKADNHKNLYWIFEKQNTSEEIINTILASSNDLSTKNTALFNLAWIINCELSGQNFGEDLNFSPTLSQISFSDLMYEWSRLSSKNIPFEEWSDLAEEGLSILNRLLDTGKLTEFKKDKQYLDFMKRFAARHEELRLQKDYKQLNEFMDD
jgi:hypothetical protein